MVKSTPGLNEEMKYEEVQTLFASNMIKYNEWPRVATYTNVGVKDYDIITTRSPRGIL